MWVNQDSPFYTAAHTKWLPSCAKVTTPELLLKAWKESKGVDYEHYGEDCLSAIGDGNRPMYIHELVQDWLPSMPDVMANLAKEGAQIADIGCGLGFTTVLLAKGFPNSTVYGVEPD